jgi:hypothetical protein
MLAKPDRIGQIARAPPHGLNPSTKRLRITGAFASTHCVKPVSREAQGLPGVGGALPVNPLNGSRVCLARRLWSSQIFCDSATDVS